MRSINPCGESTEVARVQVVREVDPGPPDDWRLCFQQCRYIYDDGGLEEGYRFIWRRDDGTLQPARGQARIPSISDAERLIAQARREGWGRDEQRPA